MSDMVDQECELNKLAKIKAVFGSSFRQATVKRF
jgi:hypothetical protein